MTPDAPAPSAPADPPVAALAYAEQPVRHERPYGRADGGMYVASAFLLGANVSLGGTGLVAGNDPTFAAAWTLATWVLFATHVILWLAGQALFWRRSDHPPPVSTFALACVAALGLAGLAVNLTYTTLIL